MKRFEFDDKMMPFQSASANYENNFRRWKMMSNEEKRQFGESPYSYSEARNVFDKMYWNDKRISYNKDIEDL
tara:strand:+ start:291 stop:506 length:216 start_codon:yes stop_codon:yes gene_type:complete